MATHIHEGIDPHFPEETAVVWLMHDDDARKPIVVLDAIEVDGDPGEVVRQIRVRRGQLEVDPASVFTYGPPGGVRTKPERDYSTEYARLGLFLAPCEAGRLSEIRWQRLRRELTKVILAEDGSLRSGLVVDERARPLIAALRTARREDLERGVTPVIDALTWALMPVPERWEEDPIDNVGRGIAKFAEMVGPVAMPRRRPPGMSRIYWDQVAASNKRELDGAWFGVEGWE